MTTTQALTLAALLIDFELESPQVTSPPEDWIRELTEARAAIQALLTQAHPAPRYEGTIYLKPTHLPRR